MAELSLTSLFSDANLQSYYKLEDTADSKGSNTLTNNNSVTFTSANYNNGANLGSSNTNKYLSTTGTMSVDGGAISISLWVKLLAEIGSSAWVFAHQVNDTSQTQFYIYYEYNAGTQKITFHRDKSGVGPELATINSGALGTSSFHHLVLVYDGVNITPYLDNVAGTPASASGNGSSPFGSPGFAIGSYNGGGNYASALIDDVAIFNKALNSTEVSTIYNEASTTIGSFFMSV